MEDDVALAGEIHSAFRELGCGVEILREGTAGLARIMADHFDLIVASLELPGMNGFRICNRVKKHPHAKTAPFFLISSQSAEATFDEHRQLATHAESYFHKPIMTSELVARARAFVPALSGNQIPIVPSEIVEVGGKSPVDASRSMPPRPNPTRPPPAVHDRLVSRPSRLPGLPKFEGESQRRAVGQLKERIVALEHDNSALVAETVEHTKQIAQLDKQLASARADKDQAARRAEDLARRLERVRPDLEAAQQELLALRDGRAADSAAHERELAAVVERERAQAERRLSELISVKERAHSEALATLRADSAPLLASLRQELSTVTALRDQALDKVESLSRELETGLAAVRAEHIEAVANRERAFEHQRVVREHEIKAVVDEAKSESRRQLERAKQELAQREHGRERKWAEARAHLENELSSARAAAERAESALAAEKEARSEEVLARARALADVEAENDRERGQIETLLSRLREAEANLVARERFFDSELSKSRDAHTREVARTVEQVQEQARSAQLERERVSTQEREERIRSIEQQHRVEVEALAKEKADALDREAAASRGLEAARAENEMRLADLERVNEDMRQQMAQEVAEAKATILELQALRERETSELRGLLELREREAAELQEREAQGSAEADAIISEVKLAATRELDEQRRQGEALLASAKENWARKRAEMGGRLEAREIERVELMARLEHIERRLAKAEQDLEIALTAKRRVGRESTLRLDALQALLDSRLDELERQGKDLDLARARLPELEAEVAVLRNELTSMRMQLDKQIIADSLNRTA